jgi:hypothetical protein
MVSRHIVSITDHSHAVILDYFGAELPDAPPELFYCLDLSWFVGKS